MQISAQLHEIYLSGGVDAMSEGGNLLHSGFEPTFQTSAGVSSSATPLATSKVLSSPGELHT